MQIRNDLRNPLPTRPPLIGRYVIVAPCAVFISRSPSAPLAGGANQVQLQPGDVVNVGDVTDGWLWVSDKADTDPGIGFLPSSYARPVL